MRNLLLALMVVSATACGANYSDGSRIGVVTKLSQKGVLWKSWEGEMIVALPGAVSGFAQPEKFEFNVSTDVVSAVSKVKDAMNSGQRVELVYRQWWIAPLTIDNDHVVVDVKVPK